MYSPSGFADAHSAEADTETETEVEADTEVVVEAQLFFLLFQFSRLCEEERLVELAKKVAALLQSQRLSKPEQRIQELMKWEPKGWEVA